MIPTESIVLGMFEADGSPYVVVYPESGLAAEYETRYRARGDTESFMDIFIGGWDFWMKAMQEIGGTHIELKAGKYLSYVIRPQVGGSRIITDRTGYLVQLVREVQKGELEDGC